MIADWRWELGTDPGEIHDLLCASDSYQSIQSGTPVPARSLDGTEWHVRAGHTWLLRQSGRGVAMFTLTPTPPYDLVVAGFLAARQPRYLQRLAVHPELAASGSLAGVRCVRKAIEIASQDGADVLRAEANPDLRATREMLVQLGFTQAGPVHEDGTGRRWVYLFKTLAHAGGRGS